MIKEKTGLRRSFDLKSLFLAWVISPAAAGWFGGGAGPVSGFASFCHGELILGYKIIMGL